MNDTIVCKTVSEWAGRYMPKANLAGNTLINNTATASCIVVLFVFIYV